MKMFTVPKISLTLDQLEIMHAVGKTCIVRTCRPVKGLGDYLFHEVTSEDLAPVIGDKDLTEDMYNLEKIHAKSIKELAKPWIEIQLEKLILV